MRIPRLFSFPQMVVVSVLGVAAGVYVYKPLLEKQIIESAQKQGQIERTAPEETKVEVEKV